MKVCTHTNTKSGRIVISSTIGKFRIFFSSFPLQSKKKKKVSNQTKTTVFPMIMTLLIP